MNAPRGGVLTPGYAIKATRLSISGAGRDHINLIEESLLDMVSYPGLI